MTLGEMTLGEMRKQAQATLIAAGLEPREAEAQADWLLAHVLGCGRLDLRLRGSETLTATQTEAINTLLARRRAGEPLQYITGTQAFFGRSFPVDARVLIPRLDTEILCEQALARLPEQARVLDIGTGSGALAISIALEKPGAQVTAVDISPDALAVAQANALRLGAKVRFLHSDLFTALPGERFEMIISNPPYIPTAEIATLTADVQCEPRLALDGGHDGLVFYRALAKEAPAHLAPGGLLLVEVGAEQADEVAALFAESIGAPFVHEDWQGIPRVVGAALKRISAKD